MTSFLDKTGLTYFFGKLKTVFAAKSLETTVSTLSDNVASLAAAVGSPLVASTAAGMTDTNKIYVYTGSEAGYTSGNWYYYDGANWTSGGVYNAVAVQTDATFSVSGAAADAKAVGGALSEKQDFLGTAYSGATISFNSGAAGEVGSLVIDINPVQAGSGDPSPSNVRAISGCTGANINHCNKNLFGVLSDGYYNANGTVSSTTANGVKYSPVYIAIGSNTSIAFSTHDSVSNQQWAGVCYYTENKTIISRDTYQQTGKEVTHTFSNFPSGAKWVRLTARTFSGNNAQFEFGAAPTSYVASTMAVTAVSWQSTAGTIYGGVFNATAGKLTVTKGNIASYNGETLPGRWISSKDVYAVGTTPSTGAQVVYDLAAPLVYQLTPIAMMTAEGLNQFWAETGDIKASFAIMGILKCDGVNTFSTAIPGSDYSTPADISASEAAVNANVDTVAKNLIRSTGDGFCPGDFDIGSIDISTVSGWTYYDNFPSRARTKEGTTIHLNAGDVIGCTSYTNMRYYIGWINSDDEYRAKGWLTADYTTIEEGDYVILLAHLTDTTLVNKNELLDLFFIHRQPSPPKSAYDLPFFNNGRMRLHAHQGISTTSLTSDLIANSVNAFEEAGKKKMFICETDLRRTSDGYIVCMHNSTVDATTNGTGTVSSMTLEQIRELRLLRKNGTASDLLVPTIDEYLRICKKYNMVAVPELKDVRVSGFVADVVAKLKAHGMTSQCMIACSIANAPAYVRSVTDLPLMLITDSGNWVETIAYAEVSNNVILTINKASVTQEMVEACHNINVPCEVHVVEWKDQADTFFDLGVDIINSDYLSESDWIS